MKIRSLWLPGALSIAGTFCTAALTGSPLAGASTLWFVVLALLWSGTQRFLSRQDKRQKVCFGLLGLAFALCCALGLRLDCAQETGWDGLALCALAALCLAPALAEGFLWIVQLLSRLKTPLRISEKKAFWLAVIVLLVCWSPVLIAFFPGIDGYDIDGQYYQILTGNYNTHHPLLHTLYLQACMALGAALFGDVSLGYGVSTLLQAVMVALALAYGLRYLRRIGCPKVLWMALLLFFALSPQHAVMVTSGIKDVPFAAVMATLTVELVRFVREPERERKPLVWVGNVVLICLACLLRNNAVYGLILVVLLAVVFWRRQLGKRVLLVLAAGTLAALGCASGLKTALQADSGSVREVLCVPCQQLARVYSLYGLEHPVGYEIREVLPFVDDYTPERADAVKRQAKVTTDERLLGFIKLWGRELFHYPQEYIDAFLLTSKGYWWVDDLSYATTYNEPGVERGCMILWHNEATTLEMQDLWPQVKELCHQLFARNGYQQYPVLWSLLQPAVYTWLLALVLAWACWKKNRAVLLAGGVSAAYLLTLLLGPCALIRYQYSLMLCAPLLAGCLTCQHKEGDL